MNKQELQQQLSELSTAANSLANALTVLHTNVSIDVPNVDAHHCGQDAEKSIEDMKHLLGYQVVGICHGKCEGCPADRYGEQCVKLDMVGGYTLCLAPLPNSIATEQS